MRSFCSLYPTKPLSVEVSLSLAVWKAFHLDQAAGDVDWVSTLPFPVAGAASPCFMVLAAVARGGPGLDVSVHRGDPEEPPRGGSISAWWRLYRGELSPSGAFSGSDVAPSHSRVNG